ncbi:MAG: pyridoxamine 5'-phosphate oxidase [Acidimicrobiales bacterium]
MRSADAAAGGADDAAAGDRSGLDLTRLRTEYQAAGLRETDAAPDPFSQFEAWFAEVSAAGLHEPNAAVLATADASGAPSARHVLVKGVDAGGFVFYTNYESRKGRELAANPRAALVFTWSALARQVSARGSAARVSAGESDRYFASRPRDSQLGAWASRQSEPLADRASLDEAFAAAAARFAGAAPPRPPYWGGYRLVPEEVEFWQGRPNRLHDRLRYRREAGGWRLERLSP